MRERAISELERKVEQSKHTFKKWITSSQSTTVVSFVAVQEIVMRVKPFIDEEYMKESFIKISEHLFSKFKNKGEIVQNCSLQRPSRTGPLKWQQTSLVSKLMTSTQLKHF